MKKKEKREVAETTFKSVINILQTANLIITKKKKRLLVWYEAVEQYNFYTTEWIMYVIS